MIKSNTQPCSEKQGGLMNEKEFQQFRDLVIKKVMSEAGDVATACAVLKMMEAQLMDRP